MKLEDVIFIREQRRIIEDCSGDPNGRCGGCEDRNRLLSLLTKSEAMQEKAKFFLWHKTFSPNPTSRMNCRNAIAGSCAEEHDWSDADWIADKEKDWRI